MEFEYAIIGQGGAAFAAAIKANALGIKTAMIGKNITNGTVIGGTCVNVGCTPTKELIFQGRLIKEISSKSFAPIIDSKLNRDFFINVMKRKDQIVENDRKTKYISVLDSLENVTYINEFASFKDPNTLLVGNKEITAKNILIATGARSNIPNIPGIGNIEYLTNEGALSLKELPESMIVIGGRALGLEFAQMYEHFGTKVTILQRSSLLLPNWEPQISSHIQKYLEEEGISINTSTSLVEVGKNDNKLFIKVIIRGKEEIIHADKILFATGRKPNIDKLKLENVSINTDKNGFIITNETLKTNNKSIYAVGDVIGQPMLETLAAKEGNIATSNIFTNTNQTINKNEIPVAVFTTPEAAMVGITDAQAGKSGISCSCNSIPMSLVPKAEIIGDTRGLVKIVINRETKKILGMHILARTAADMIHEGVLAVKFGLTIDDIINTTHVFPTMSEAVKLAAQSFYSDMSKMSCCTV